MARQHYQVSREQMIAQLRERIADDAKNHASDGAASWGYETGVLLSRNEAEQIIRWLTADTEQS